MSYPYFRGAVGRLNKSVFDLVQFSLCLDHTLSSDLKMQECEQSKADPCVSRKRVEDEFEVVQVIHEGDNLVSTVHTERRHWSSSSRTKVLGEASYCLACHIERNRDGRAVELNKLLYAKPIAEHVWVVQTNRTMALAGSKRL